ncbi:MAG: hypothetical protein HY951_09650 [Bacteroidia bacterium]|nr:hypothetical protein [Bacteroidia bacterium]
MTKTTGIRLEVPQHLYDKLQEEQEYRTPNTGKKPSLASIILDFCNEKLDNNVHEHFNVHESAHNSVATNKTDSKLEKQLKNWEEKLAKWDNSLKERERKSKELEKIIYQERMEVMDMRNKVLDEREKVYQNALAGSETLVDNKFLHAELKHKDEKIKQLEKDQAYDRSKLLRTIEKNNKEETKSIWDHIKDNLPLIIGGFTLLGAYLLSKKDNKPKLPKEMDGLVNMINQMDEQGKKIIAEKLISFTEQHTEVEKKKNETTEEQKPPFQLKI